MKHKISKRVKTTIYTLVIFLIVIGMGVFFMLLALDVVKGKKASNGVMWTATAFCLLIGCGGFFYTILALIKEKIRNKQNLEEDKNKEEQQLSEEALVFKNAIPELFTNKKLNNIDNKEKKNYIFKQRKQSIVKFALFDDKNNLVYDSKRINKTLFVPLKISFNNHISSKSFTHTIGRMLITDLESNNTYFIPTAYTYRIDDLRVEDFFKRLDIQLIAASEHVYNINYKGSLIGSIDIIKDNKLNLFGKKVNDMKINCIEEYIDIAFLSCFAIGYATHLTN